jgi:hypothetical protein
VAVLAAGDRAEEQRLLGPRGRGDAALVRVGVVLRRLHERDAVVGQVAERRGEEPLVRDVVAVQHGDVRRRRVREGMVDVPRLGALVALAGHPPRAVALGQRAHLGPRAVVEQVHVHAGAGEPGRRGDGRLDDRHGLVVGRDEHVDLGRVTAVLERELGPRPHARARPPEAGGLDDVEHLGGDQHAVEHRMTDPLGLEQPDEVQERERRRDAREQAQAGAVALRRARLPPRRLEANVGHRRGAPSLFFVSVISQMRICGYFAVRATS